MKKILIALLLAISAFSYSQDETEWLDAAVSNQIPALGEMLYTYVSGSDTLIRRVQGDYIQPYYFFNDNIYPRKTQNNLVLGTTSNASGHKLLVNGTSYFNEYIWLNSTLFFKHGRIYSSSDNLYFRDNTAGTYSLSDLAQAFPSDDSLRGLIEGYDGLDLSISTLDFDGSPSIYKVDESEIMFNFPSSVLDNLVIRPGLIGNALGYAIYYNSTDLKIGIYATEGEFMPQWTFNQSYVFSETDTLATQAYARSYGGGSSSSSGPGGTYDATVANNDTTWIPAYDTASNEYAWLPIVRDTLATNYYMNTIAITAANINNGDTITLVSTPGTGKSVFPEKIMVYMNGNTAVTGTDNSQLGVGPTLTMHDLTVSQLGLSSVTQTYNYVSLYSSHVVGNETPVNKPITLIYDSDLSGTNRAGWIKIWYNIVTH